MRKKLSIIFLCASVLLFGAMCAVVAYEYAALHYCGMYGLCSAPASVAFFFAIPFVLCIGICVLLAIRFKE